MALWRSSLDPFITILPIGTSSILALLLQPPRNTSSIHICLYLPTAGKDPEYVVELSKLEVLLEELSDKYPGVPVYYRGDGNANMRNQPRSSLLQHFITKHSITRLPLNHTTYHHFMGNGLSDSEIDVLMYSGERSISETLLKIHCKLTNPLIDSLHDLLVSSFPSPPSSRQPECGEDLVSAPRMENKRVRVRWEEEGIEAYEVLLGSSLEELRDRWSSKPSLTSFSILLEATNHLLSSAATQTNKSTRLADNVKKKPRRHPDIKAAQKKLAAAQQGFTSASDDEGRRLAGEARAAARLEYRQAIRREQQQDCDKRDTQMHQILSKNPQKGLLARSTFTISSAY